MVETKGRAPRKRLQRNIRLIRVWDLNLFALRQNIVDSMAITRAVTRLGKALGIAATAEASKPTCSSTCRARELQEAASRDNNAL